MKLSSYTGLAFLVNRVINANPIADLSYDEIWDATDEGRLISLLADRYGHLAEFTFITHPGLANLEQMEAAPRDAAAGYLGRIRRPDGPFSGLCLVMDIILEAIQQHFCQRPSSGDSPEEPAEFPVTE